VQGAGGVRLKYEKFASELSASEVEVAIEKSKGYELSGTLQIPGEVIQEVGGGTVYSEVHKLIKFILKKEELPHQWKESIVVPIHEGIVRSRTPVRMVQLPNKLRIKSFRLKVYVKTIMVCILLP
jgi:hypothetical protein